ncbi:dephospho-CoA kinase [Nemorincola caseinilytica]|uniref:Dephospho-CoA kinase n=1 Tax=Nemorincola caseinilytica TaxID=2054315 RepID=A0ABP8NLK6_9BACT
MGHNTHAAGPLRVGITGGIGSGKSIVCRVFATLGIPVLSADDTSRHLLDHDITVKQAIMQALGTDTYINGCPDREKIAAIVYRDPQKLQQLNAIVHPATIRYADEWLQRHSTLYVIKEAAIFFESGTHTGMDVMVGISAPRELRIQRAMQRGGTTREKIESIMARQMDEDEKMRRCDHVIINDDATAILPQVLHLHHILLSPNPLGSR